MGDAVKTAFGWIIDGLLAVADVAVMALPDSPFTFFDNIPQEFKQIINALNYFIPFYTFVSILEIWLVAIIAYYAVQGVLRWGKTIN